MSLVVACSAHGAPGVTTSVLALAAAWPTDRTGAVLIEADPSGGVLAARFGLGDSPGVASLAVAARNGLTPATLMEHAQVLPGGLPLVVGPATPEQTSTVLPDVAASLRAVAVEMDVVVDAGRFLPGSPASALVCAADLTLVVVRPSTDQLRPVAHRVAALQASGVAVSLLLVGDEPYGPTEVATTLGVPVVGVLAWDPRTAAVFTGDGTARAGVQRSLLARSAVTVASDLIAALSPTLAPTDVDDPAGSRAGVV